MIRYLTYGLIFALAYVIGLFITPLNYFVKDWVRKYNIVSLWWFLNDTKPFDKNDIDYGDYGRFKHNFIGFYRQTAIRNSHWNLRVLLGKKLVGVPTDIKGEMVLLNTNWNYKVGKTFATYKVNGIKRFKMSMIYEFWKFYIHYQFGTNDQRYVYKVKLGLK